MAVKINRGVSYGNIIVTPMIDFLLFLLIFFLVATNFDESEREMSVVLPQASEAMPLIARPKELFVNVTQQGKFVVSGETVNAGQLFGIFQSASANNPHQTVIIRGDKRCPLEHVVTVMNLCNKAKIRDYRVTAAEPRG